MNRPQRVTIADGVAKDAVRRQVASGVDVVSDGEMSKISYATYIKDRLTGFRWRYAARAGPGSGGLSAHLEASRGHGCDGRNTSGLAAWPRFASAICVPRKSTSITCKRPSMQPRPRKASSMPPRRA